MIGQVRANYNGVRTRVLSVPGGGTPLVLLHGYAGSADTWRAVLTGLEQAGRRALAVDLPGFGRADPRVSGPMLPQFDGFVDAILDQDGPAVLVGNSLGAATAVRAASRNSEAVKGVVALDDPLNAQHWLARLARRREIPEVFWSWVGRVRIPPSVLRWVTRRAVAKVVYGPGAVADPDVVAYWSRLFSQTSDAALLGRYMFQYAYGTAAGHQDVHVT
jgi:pimeloyl-ACP methyl ester carboxylesterase